MLTESAVPLPIVMLSTVTLSVSTLPIFTLSIVKLQLSCCHLSTLSTVTLLVIFITKCLHNVEGNRIDRESGIGKREKEREREREREVKTGDHLLLL